MADVEFDGFDDGETAPEPGRAGRLLQGAGAAVSVALIVGLAVWGYKLAVRDVTGIPVVRALSDPMRIAPENPGGQEAMHQGLSVNAVAAAGTVSPLPDTLVLAPPEIELAAEDIAGLAPSDQPAAGAAVTAASTPVADGAAPVLSASAAVEPAPAPVASEATAALSETAPSEEEAVAAALASALGEAPAEVAGAPGDGLGAAITRTPRPPARPAALLAAINSLDPATVEAAAAVTAPELDPATIAVGARLAQLGAFDDEISARAEWGKLQAAFPDLIAGKSLVIQSAQSGGRTFYRLRAFGFDDEAAARAFCARLLAGNASCIPVTQR